MRPLGFHEGARPKSEHLMSQPAEKSGYDLEDAAFWSTDGLESELRRVYGICNGCRLCYNLCPSFPALFNRVDELDPHRHEAEGALLAEGAPMAEEDAASALAGIAVSTANPIDPLQRLDLQRVVDLCYNCKLCFPICPYVPPHEFAVDFPRLMLRAKAVKARDEGVTLQDRFLGATDAIGTLMTSVPKLANWAQHNAFNRMLMEQTVGIHRDRKLPGWTEERFETWWQNRRQAAELPQEQPQSGAVGQPKALLFYTCFHNYNDPEVAKAAVEVLERSGVLVAAPPMRCCGMPSLDGGDIDTCVEQVRENLERLLPYVRAGYAVVSPGPTCTFMLRQEYPELVKSDETREVASAVRDLGEYLVELKKRGVLDLDLGEQPPQKVAYHFPCHLKVQKIGYKGRDVLRMIPGTEVELVDQCCGMDGTWGMKTEFFQLSVKVAEKATNAVAEIQSLEAQTEKPRSIKVSSDCPLAALQLRQTTGQEVVHPIILLRDAYRAADARQFSEAVTAPPRRGV
jgi:glycerol-3-phosphate dehydrogenase subunit C